MGAIKSYKTVKVNGKEMTEQEVWLWDQLTEANHKVYHYKLLFVLMLVLLVLSFLTILIKG